MGTKQFLYVCTMFHKMNIGFNNCTYVHMCINVIRVLGEVVPKRSLTVFGSISLGGLEPFAA